MARFGNSELVDATIALTRLGSAMIQPATMTGAVLAGARLGRTSPSRSRRRSGSRGEDYTSGAAIRGRLRVYTETELIAFYEKALRLLDIPEAGPEGHEARMEIREMTKAANKKQAPPPDLDELRRKDTSGRQLGSMLSGAYAAAEASVAIVPRAASQTGGLPSVSPEGTGDPADSRGEIKPLARRVKSGRAPGARTRNLRIKSPQLCQLS